MSIETKHSSVWLITGGTSGFGKRIVYSSLARGDRVIATGRTTEKIEQLVSGVKPELIDNLRTVLLDVTEGEEAIKIKIDEAVAFWGGIDVLVSNAGFGLPGLLEEGGTKIMRRQFDTNVFGLLDVTNAALPYLRQSKAGRMVVVGSRSAWRAELPGIGNYAASKAALRAITETLTVELSQFNIRVVLVEPGAFRTEGIYGQKFFADKPIADYDALRTAAIAGFSAVGGTQDGDPDKAAEAIVDVVRGEGVAKGRPWPEYLLLGYDAEANVRGKCSKVLKVLDEWLDVTRGVNFD
ncbi:NAD(P)-binding protein [Phlegmacium glaucopus]|nr:NAD(P)-binding protein [Phlegmacium glaucopus]